MCVPISNASNFVGFVHSAFTFGQESFITASEIRPASVPPGHLISVLQRGLQYSALEAHINEDGSERACNQPFNLLQPHSCEAPSEPTNEPLSAAMDAPLQNSLSALNLALQNASVMATNAVYGTGIVNTSSSNTVTSTSNTTTNASNATTPTGGARKKPRKERKESTTATSTASSAANNSDCIELIGHSSEVSGVAWNPVNASLASASGDSTIRLWSLPASSLQSAALFEVNPRVVMKNCRALEHVLFRENDSNYDVTCLEWRRDGALLVSGCYDGKARLWTAQGDLVRTLQRHSGPIFTCRWSPSGRFLLTGGADGLAIVWDADGGGVRQVLAHHKSSCLDAEWLNETCFVTGGSDGQILLYDLGRAPAEGTGEAFEPLAVLLGHEDEVNTVRFNQELGLLASCSDDRTVRLWKPFESAEAVAVLKGHEKEIYTLKWSNTPSNLLATASFDNTVRVWSSQGECKHVLMQHTQPVYAIAFSPCGRYLASGSLDESVIVWSLESGRSLKVHSFTGAGGCYDLDWREAWIGAGIADGRVAVIEFVETPEVIDEPALNTESNEVSIDTEQVAVIEPPTSTANDMQVDKEDGEVSMSD